jgi:putative addiction module antidote
MEPVMQRFSLKLTQVGNSMGLILPKEVVAVLRAEKGDTITATETANGLSLSVYDPDVERQVEAGREVMREYRDTLRNLAK